MVEKQKERGEQPHASLWSLLRVCVVNWGVSAEAGGVMRKVVGFADEHLCCGVVPHKDVNSLQLVLAGTKGD